MVRKTEQFDSYNVKLNYDLSKLTQQIYMVLVYSKNDGL